jgi:hypothetical protein
VSQRAQNLGLLREATLLLLREDERAAGDHVVLALGPFDRLGLETLLVQLSRETRSSFVVPASDRAVEDLDAHRRIVTGALRVTNARAKHGRSFDRRRKRAP